MQEDQYSHSSGYKPYCCMCRSMNRMRLTSFGWECTGYCGNMINKDKTRHTDSPLNNTVLCQRLIALYGEDVHFDESGRPRSTSHTSQRKENEISFQ